MNRTVQFSGDTKVPDSYAEGGDRVGIMKTVKYTTEPEFSSTKNDYRNMYKCAGLVAGDDPNDGLQSYRK
jgi:hypothetical protein